MQKSVPAFFLVTFSVKAPPHRDAPIVIPAQAGIHEYDKRSESALLASDYPINDYVKAYPAEYP